uniref:Uncharacterized protein n=1 Tax=Oryza punctata TaxID=4537 RepID=A0A0E0MLI1_ORYPU
MEYLGFSWPNSRIVLAYLVCPWVVVLSKSSEAKQECAVVARDNADAFPVSYSGTIEPSPSSCSAGGHHDYSISAARKALKQDKGVTDRCTQGYGAENVIGKPCRRPESRRF